MGNLRANELRIGNYYYGDVLFPSEYNVITANDLVELDSDPLDDYYQPLPLTEEWLLKFGFEKKENSLFTKKLEYIYNSLKYCEDYKIWIYYNDDNDAACNSIADLNFVHQLQNLYFALTNEELTIM
jgi:hypothetical protein